VPSMNFPDAEHPAFPRLGIEVPDGWTPTAAPGAVMAALKPTPPGEFAPNVVVSLTRFGQDHSLDTSIAALRTELGSNGQAAWGDEARSQTTGAEGFATEVAITDPRAGTVMQGHRLLLVHHGPVSDLVHAVASCAADQVEHHLPELRAALDSLTINA